MTHLILIEPRRNLSETCLKLWIADYYDELTNKIDIYTENIIAAKEKGNDSLNGQKHNDLYFIREKFLQTVEVSQLNNFSAFEENVKKIKQVLKDDEIFQVNNEQIEWVKSVLFESFCFLLFDEAIEKCFKLKLVQLDWYLSEYQHKILRFYFAKFVYLSNFLSTQLFFLFIQHIFSKPNRAK